MSRIKTQREFLLLTSDQRCGMVRLMRDNNEQIHGQLQKQKRGLGRLSGSGFPEYERNAENRRQLVPGIMRRTYIAKEMNDRHHEVSRMIVLGYKHVEIARILKITSAYVDNVSRMPAVKEQVALLRGSRDSDTVDLAQQIQIALPECIKYLTKTINDPEISDSIKSRNAFGLLATGGHGPSKNVNIKGVHAVLTSDDIREIRENAERVAMEIGIVEEDEDD